MSATGPGGLMRARGWPSSCAARGFDLTDLLQDDSHSYTETTQSARLARSSHRVDKSSKQLKMELPECEEECLPLMISVKKKSELALSSADGPLL